MLGGVSWGVCLERTRKHWPGLGAAGATLLLGLWRLDVPTPHYDEPLYVAVGRRYLDGDLNHTLEHPPVATYAFGVAQLLFGDGIPSARLASFVVILGSCPLLDG